MRSRASSNLGLDLPAFCRPVHKSPAFGGISRVAFRHPIAGTYPPMVTAAASARSRGMPHGGGAAQA